MPKLIRNSEPYPQFAEAAAMGRVPPDGANWPVGWVVWILQPDGTKRWVGTDPESAAYASDPYTLLSTGQIQQLPQWQPSQGGGFVYDETFAQAVINATARLLADETIVQNTPIDGTSHFKRA